MIKNTKEFKSTIFLLTTLLSIGTFTGCGGSSTTGSTAENYTAETIDEGPVAGNIDETTGSTTANTAESNTVDTDVNNNEETTGNTVVDSETAIENVNLQKGWYVKLTVQSDVLKDDGTVFGYLEGASDGKDRYESEALSSSGLYTTIYHESFGNTKHYRSDYRAYKEAGEKSDIWMIKVNSGDTNADVTLSWNGITYVTRSTKGGFDEEVKTDSLELNLMRLIDVETGDVISATDNGMKITFNMNGQRERTFQWILLADGDSEPDVKPNVKMTVPSLRSIKVQEVKPEESDLGFTPPRFEKR